MHFFCTSRRRHTRLTCDWSSDVCSSDLLAGLAGAWVKVVLTDPARPVAPMERLRGKWPHTIALEFDPDGGLSGADADLARVAKAADPVEICESFVEYVAGVPADAAQRAVLRAVVEAAQHASDDGPGHMAGAGLPVPARAGGA